jgi:mRNA guanylyltransferase
MMTTDTMTSQDDNDSLDLKLDKLSVTGVAEGTEGPEVPDTTPKGEVRLADSKTGPKSIQVSDPKKVEFLKNFVLSFWPNRKNDFFPAPQPVSLERRDIFRLKKFPYVACAKSDGMRFVMICTTVPGGNQECFMVDRAFRFYKVDQCFDEGVYKNTMFDGELVRTGPNRDQWRYIIHDCIVYQGTNISQDSFTDRYEHVTISIENFWDEGGSSFPVQTKRFYKFSELGELSKAIENKEINHNTDGVILTPVSLPVGMHTQYTLFKWKPRELHTFDFKVVERGTDLVAQVNEKGSLVDFASVSTVGEMSEVGRMFQSGLKKIDYKDGNIVECNYNEVTECFEPVLIRNDKTHPNGIFTVEKTLLNIRENITMDEMIRISSR